MLLAKNHNNAFELVICSFWWTWCILKWRKTRNVI